MCLNREFGRTRTCCTGTKLTTCPRTSANFSWGFRVSPKSNRQPIFIQRICAPLPAPMPASIIAALAIYNVVVVAICRIGAPPPAVICCPRRRRSIPGRGRCCDLRTSCTRPWRVELMLLLMRSLLLVTSGRPAATRRRGMWTRGLAVQVAVRPTPTIVELPPPAMWRRQTDGPEPSHCPLQASLVVLLAKRLALYRSKYGHYHASSWRHCWELRQR